MSIPKELRFTREHEWVRDERGQVTVGISDFAQHELGDVVFVDLPEVGKVLKQGESFAVVESVKAASDVYAPVSGKVVKRNDALSSNPELINGSPYSEAWLAVIEPSDPGELEGLLSAADYEKYLKEIAK